MVVEDDVGALQPAVPLHVDGFRTVNEDVANGWVPHQRLQRTKPEGFVDHFIDQALALTGAEQVGAEAAQLLGEAADLHPQIVLAQRGEGRQVHGLDELLMKSSLVGEKTFFGVHAGSFGAAAENREDAAATGGYDATHEFDASKVLWFHAV